MRAVHTVARLGTENSICLGSLLHCSISTPTSTHVVAATSSSVHCISGTQTHKRAFRCKSCPSFPRRLLRLIMEKPHATSITISLWIKQRPAVRSSHALRPNYSADDLVVRVRLRGLLCGKQLDEWFIEIRDKPLFFAHQHAAPGYLHGNAQTSFSWDLKHMELKGTDAGQGIPELTKTQRLTAPSEWQII